MSSRLSDVELWLREHLGTGLGVKPVEVDPNEPLSRYGIDSVKAIELISALSTKLGRNLSPALIWEYPTVRSLALYAAGELPSGREDTASAAPATEPIAIVGISCRFPGAPNPDAFWRLLSRGKDAIREIPADRWDAAAYYDPDPSAAGKMNVRFGGFLDQVDQFEPQFFGISPREAIQIDPQQRLILELAWEALEDAGIQADRLRDSDAGVFMGVTFHDYADLHLKMGASITAHTGPGQAFDIIANRVSYAFGFQGPSIAVDTACSSSLVAVHLACMSLRNGESDLCLAGGVNLILSPETMVMLSKFGGLSPDGRCRPFDAAANGFARGEGAGIVVLKPLSRALADGDRVYCTILGSATNNDGASNGLSAPNPRAQEKLLRQAYRLAGVPHHRVHYIEAHGTGTPLGDPIEARALGAVLCSGREANRALRIGSVKSNIGHLESAAGIAGLIKTALSVKHRAIPPSLHYQQPNPYVAFDELKLKVQDAFEAWPVEDEPATAGVSSFGWGGTNCHVVLQELDPDRYQLFPLAAPSANETRRRAQSIQDMLAVTELPLSEVCLSSALSLARETHRVAVVTRSTGDLADLLKKVVQSQTSVRQVSGAPKAAFVFSPHGGHWTGMGRGLMRSEPVFHAKLLECAGILRELAGWDLVDIVASEKYANRLSDNAIALPLVAAIQISLVALWRSWGIEPAAVAGHSIGEVAAAHTAGILSLEDAMTTIFHYGRLLARDSCKGTLAIAGLGPDEIQEFIETHGLDLCLAANNDPESSVVSGDAAAADRLVAELNGRGIYASRVNINAAPHSARVDSVLDEYRMVLQKLKPRDGRIPMISTVTGAVQNGHDCDGNYWARNLRQPILFAPAMNALFADHYRTFLEIGPHTLLNRAVHALSPGATVLPSMRRSENERRTMLESLGQLYQLGFDVRWSQLYPANTAIVSLPGAETAEPAEPASLPRLFTLSAQSTEALRDLAGATAEIVEARTNASVEDFCSTSTLRRSHLSHRLALVCTSRDQLGSELRRFSGGESTPRIIVGRKHSSKRPPVVFVYCGQGPQWWAMARQCFEREPVFRETLKQCDGIGRAFGARIIDEFAACEAASKLGNTEVAQPVLVSLQIALSHLWQSWGIEPDAVVGHSVGEIAAAHVAGVFGLEDAILIACHRGRLMQRATGFGKMAAVALGLAESERLLSAFNGKVEVAAINAPASTVWSGEPGAVDAALGIARERGIVCRPLAVNYAFHSAQMEPFQDELKQAVDGIRLSPPRIPIVSTVTGRQAIESDYGAAYWARLREPVQFAAATQSLIDAGFRTFLEIGPHPVLGSAISECLENAAVEGTVLPSLRRGQDDHAVLFDSSARLYVSGHSLTWRNLSPGNGRFVNLPLTAWQRQRYWIEGRLPMVRQAPVPVSVAEQTIDDSAYAIEWRPVLRSARPGPVRKGRWLILADTLGVADHLASRLEAGGSQCARVPASADADDLAPFIGDASTLRGIINLWPVHSSADFDLNVSSLESAQNLGCGRVIRLLQALRARKVEDGLPLYLVTRGVIPASPGSCNESSLPHSTIWGLGRVLSLEHPELDVRLIDLDPGANPRECAASLFTETAASDDENQLAFRGNERLAARLVRRKITHEVRSGFEPGGAYLITGGTGALGLQVAGWLAEQGVRHLVLLSRRAERVLPVSQLQHLRELGCRVDIVSADVSDAQRMQSVLDELRSAQLRGVFHLAGTLNRFELAHASADELISAMCAKVSGGWVLHQLTRDLPLTHFVCFSSIASVWGSRGMAAYAAANHFLDTLAHYRRASGLAGVSINWGPWSGGGMASDEEREASERIGIDALSPERALKTLGAILQSGHAQTVVTRVRWNVFRLVYEARRRRPLLDGINEIAGPSRETTHGNGNDPGRGRLAVILRNAAPEKRVEILRKSVAHDAREILGLPDARPLDWEQGFFEMGMDSLMAVEFKRRLEFALACTLPRTVAFEYPNVMELAAHLVTQFDEAQTGSVEHGNPEADAYDDLSESEAEALLVRRLASMGDPL